MIPNVVRVAARIAAGSLALAAVVILGGNDSAFAAQTVTVSIPTTTLIRGALSNSGATTQQYPSLPAGQAMSDPGTTATNDTFLASNMDVLQVGMVIQVENELMLVTALTEGALNPDTITVNRGTVAGFSGAGVVTHAINLAIFRNINFVPVNVSTVATENAGNLTVALDANEFENSGSRLGSATNASATLLTVDNVAPLYTGRTLQIDAEKMLVADGVGDPDQIATYPGWTNNSGATISMTTDEDLVFGMCDNNTDDDGDGKINDGCPPVANVGIAIGETGAECDNNIDENTLDTAGTGHEDDDGDPPHDETVDDGDGGKVNDGCPVVENTLRVSNSSLLVPGWTIKVDNEFMKIVTIVDLTTITVDRAINSIMTSHTSGTIIWGGPDKVEVQRGYAGTTAASHNFLAPISENVRTLTVDPAAAVTESSHFQIDSEKFTAVTAPDVNGKLKAIRAILGTSIAAHNTVPAAVTLIDGLGGASLTIAYPTSHLDYRLMQPGTFLISTGRTAPATSCYAPQDLTGSVGVVCSTQGETPLGPFGMGTVMSVGFTALATTPQPQPLPPPLTLTLSLPGAADTSGDPYNAQAGAAATIKIFLCPDFDPTPNYNINAVDIGLVRSKFGQSASANPLFDINQSGGNIDAADIGVTRSQFGTRCYRP